jgi:nitroreductase
MRFKKLVLTLVPQPLHRLIRDVYFALRLLPNALYDYRRYLLWSGMNKSRGTLHSDAARVTLFYHQVEKGLSLRSPRPGFGAPVVSRLIDDIGRFFRDRGVREPGTTGIAALSEYVKFNQRSGVDASAVQARLDRVLQDNEVPEPASNAWEGGVIELRRSDIDVARNSGFAAFFASRHSIRQFSGEPVSFSVVEEAVRIAQKTPSVCNRQSWRVHVVTNKDIRDKVLAIQAGNRGFGEDAGALLVVTCELGCFTEVSERYQAWIDGGMFSMSICLAFHHLGFGTCCLNWSKEYSADKALRTVMPVPKSEQVIMCIAVGGLPDEFRVARSYRPRVDTILTEHS